MSSGDPRDAQHAALADLYRAVDETFAGWSCPASTECCRFGITGREPYVTSIELAEIRRAIAANGGRAALAHAKSGRRKLDVVDAERRCPMLDATGRCSIYASRPLGCRTFFCDRATPGGRVKHAAVQAFVRELQEIAARHEVGGERGRPLTRAL